MLVRAVTSALASCTHSDEVVVADHDPNARPKLAPWAEDRRLRVLDNTWQGGASETRNVGVAAAVGDTVLFLDDDDELVPGYTDSIRGKTKASWGFGSQVIRCDSDDATAKTGKLAARGGVPGPWVPFRRKLGALGAGFWVRRSVFQAVGCLSVDHKIDEDTDLCCRLLAARHQPWIDQRPAMIIDRLAETPRLTNLTDAETRALCYLKTYTRNFRSLRHERGATTFLAFRAQRMILRSGKVDLLAQLYDDVPSNHLRALLYAKYLIKRFKQTDTSR